MFTSKDIQSIDKKYFTILSSSAFCITLQSNKTKHCWHIVQQSYPHFTSCQIYHTQKESTPYHLHGHAANLYLALKKIRQHDSFQLNGRKML